MNQLRNIFLLLLVAGAVHAQFDQAQSCPSGQYQSWTTAGTAECLDCPAGTYNDEGLMVDYCAPCMVGSYNNKTGQSECQWCWDGTTFDVGATSQDQCVDRNSRNHNSFMMRIFLDVSVTGDMCTNISETLMGVSNLQIQSLNVDNCETSDEGGDITTTMSIQFTIPQTWGLYSYSALRLVQGFLPTINAYIGMGSQIIEYGFSELNKYLMELPLGGMQLNADALKIGDFRVKQFSPRFEEICVSGMKQMEASDGNVYCVTPSGTEAEEAYTYYMARFEVSGDANFRGCGDNAGKSVVRNIFNKAANYASNKWACFEDGSCETIFGGCRLMSNDASEALLIVKTTNKAVDAQMASFSAVHVGEGLTFTYKGGFGGQDCMSKGIKVSDGWSSMTCEACKAGYYTADNLECTPCPFGSYGLDGDNCIPCHTDLNTPYWGATSEAECMEHNVLREGYNMLDIAVDFRLDSCSILLANHRILEKCEAEGVAEASSFEEAWTANSTSAMICYFMNWEARFEEACPDYDGKKAGRAAAEWEHLYENPGCYLLNWLHEAAELTNEAEKQCTSDDDKRYLSFPREYELGVDGATSAYMFPILKGLSNLVTMRFSDFAVSGMAAAKRFGLDDLNALMVGMTMGPEVMNMIMAVPRSVDFTKWDMETTYDKSNFFCDNGNAKEECWDNQGCGEHMCPMTDEDRSRYWDMQCDYDSCNNCTLSVTVWDNEKEERVPFECRSCNFPDEIENGRKKEEWGTSAKYECNDGFRAKWCNNWASCDINNAAGEKNIPECIENNCSFEDSIENGNYNGSWVDEGCPTAKYSCDNGYSFANYGGGEVRCTNENGKVDDHQYPTCMENCEFPDSIDNGMKGEEGYEGGRWYAEYRCNDGYFPEYTRKYCYQSYENGKDMLVPDIPTCNKAQNCTLPEYYEGAKLSSTWMSEEGWVEGYYYCEDSEQEGNGWSKCEDDMPITNIRCMEKRCYYDHGAVENGWVDREDSGAVWFRCSDTHEMEGDARAGCVDGVASYPECKEIVATCELPDYIENGYIAEDKVNKKRYECNTWNGWKLPEGHDGWAWCNGTEAVNVPECEEWRCDFQNITNGVLEGVSENGMGAWYKCNDGFRILEHNWASCDVHGNYKYPECIEAGEPCHFPHDLVANGNITSDVMDYKARYECNEGYEMEGSDWVMCDGDGNLSEAPECKKYYSCAYPDIENGYKVEEYDHGARYMCDEGYYMEGSDWAYCDRESGTITGSTPMCRSNDDDDDDDKDEVKCDFPEMISGGFMVWDSSDYSQAETGIDNTRMRVVKYHCYDGLAVVSNPADFSEDAANQPPLLEVYGVGLCMYESGHMIMPECKPKYEAGHCYLPDYPENGRAIQFNVSETNPLAPVMAQYQCNEGFMMVETTRGDWGWCREDYSMEIPHCRDPTEWSKIEFKLENGGALADNIGRVLARSVNASGAVTGTGDWMTGCDDDFNDNAAGAICRSLGYRGGVRIDAPSKLKTVSNAFGWTKVQCQYDDTLITSDTCHGEAYGEGALCLKNEQIAVKCFNEDWSVDVSVDAAKSFKKMFCKVDAVKADSKMNLKDSGLDVKFYRWDSNGDNMAQYENEVKYTNKKGFKISIKGGDKPDCYGCTVSMGDKTEFAANSEKCEEALKKDDDYEKKEA